MTHYHRFGTLASLALVFLASVLLSLFIDPNTAVEQLAQYPAIAALLGIVWKILSDEIRDQREIQKSAALALNSLFAGSHYASRVYDRQLEFCEGYWGKVIEIVKELERTAGTRALVEQVNKLFTYRMERAIWLSEDMMLDLEGFERALRSLGAESHRLETLPVGQERRERDDRTTRRFEGIMRIGNNTAREEKVPSYFEVLAKLQEVLGITTAYAWRQDFLESAAHRARRVVPK